MCALRASGESNADHAAEVAHLPCSHLVIGVFRKPRIVDPFDLGVRAQPLGELARVLTMPLHPNRKRLDTAKRQPAIEGTGNPAGRVLVERDRL